MALSCEHFRFPDVKTTVLATQDTGNVNSLEWYSEHCTVSLLVTSE